MFKKLILLVLTVFSLASFAAFAIEITTVASGENMSGSYAGIECFGQNLCLAGFRTDTEFGGAKIRRSIDSGKTWSAFLSIEGAESARAYYFAKSGNIILASGGAGGAEAGGVPNIFRSTDNGITWKTIANSSRIRSIQNANKSTGVYNILYLGNHTFIAGLESAPVIIKSIDDGITWSFDKKLEGKTIRRMYNMGDGNLIAVAYGSGIWKSSDNGKTWKKKNSSPINAFSTVNFGNGIYLAGTAGNGGNQNIYKSIDFGETWKKVANVSTASGLTYVRTIINVGKGEGYAFLAGNEYSQTDRALKTYKSLDFGQSWALIPNFLKSSFGELNAVYDAANSEPGVFIMGSQPDSNIYRVKFN